jgi:Domain of unknown function (DUF4190)
MSTYPGENPQQQPEDAQPTDEQPADVGDQGGTEPTQPVGYWERQAAEQARQQTQDQSATRPYEQGPYAQPVQPYAPPVQPYPQPPYGQPAYGQPPYGQSYYGQPAYSPQPPYCYPPAYAAFTPPVPDHKQANLSLILGICGLAFGFMCGIGFLASPFAWALGHNAIKEIRASQGRLGGEGTARAGMVIGIIGTVLLVLAVLALIAFAVLIAVGGSSSGSSI